MKTIIKSDNIDNIKFNDYVFKIQLMDPQERAKSLYYALLNKDTYKINAHGMYFQSAPYNMRPVVNQDKAMEMINNWLNKTNFKRPQAEISTEFVGEVLAEILD